MKQMKQVWMAGMGLIDAIVALGVLSISALILIGYMGNAEKQNKKLEFHQDLELVRLYLRANIDCTKTFQNIIAGTCPTAPGTYIDAYNANGTKIVLANQSSRVGLYQVRLSCPTSAQELVVEARRTISADSTDVPLDPVTGFAMTWQDPFRGIPPLVNATSGGVLDFESIPGAFSGMPITNNLDAKYHVTFTPIQGGALQLVDIVQPPYSTNPTIVAWDSANCHEPANHNIICNPSQDTADNPTTATAGRWALSTTSAVNTKNIEFDVTYSTSVRSLSFDIIDIDGSESWDFQGYSAAGPIPAAYVHYNSKGYGPNSGNNGLTRVTISSNATDIIRVKFHGTKNIWNFGFAFDNFSTGVPSCLAW